MADIEENKEETPGEDINIEDTEELGVENKEVVEEEADVEKTIDVDKIEIETRKYNDEEVKYGDDIDPDDVKTIGSIVKKETEGFRKQLQETQDKLEVDSFIQEKPEFAKYKTIMLKYLQHPVYSKIPVKNIAAMVASSDLIKLGARKEREAQSKTDATKSGGTPVRKSASSGTDWTKVPKAEFEAQKLKVMRGE